MNNNIKSSKKYKKIMTISIIILLFLFLLSFTLGHYNISIVNTIKIIISNLTDKLANLFGAEHMFDINNTWTSQMESVIINIRLPRIVLACLVGAGLSVAGCAFQSSFSNPMASPDMLGASSGAGFGASIAILLNFNSGLIIFMSFVFSLSSVFIVYLISKFSKRQSLTNLILSGIVVSSLFSSGISLIKLIADPSDKLPKITYWLMGSLSGANINNVAFVLIIVIVSLIPIVVLKYKLNYLGLSIEEANSMGVDVKTIRLIVVILSSLIVACCVSVSGMIGWVGLIVPHIVRKLVGSNYKYVVPLSIVIGAIFVLLVDNISRNLFASEIPIGILTSFVGGPFFIALLFSDISKH